MDELVGEPRMAGLERQERSDIPSLPAKSIPPARRGGPLTQCQPSATASRMVSRGLTGSADATGTALSEAA